MRILNIYFKNINSLEGEGRVYFDQGPIADSGVFAITGPNGSGKSSILDVITLGLYGETYRFDKPAEQVITKHTNESFAQVDFAYGDDTFRSSWHVIRGESALPDMQLQRLNGGNPEIVAESPYQVRNYLSALTGMDFHKFSKAIVLPQGDFAAFLNALDSERLDILEKIGGSDLYVEYRQQTETRHQELTAQLAALEREINLLPLLSPEAIAAAELDLQDFAEQSNDLKKEQEQFQQQLQRLQHFKTLERQRDQLLTQQQALLAQIEKQRNELKRISASSHVNRLQDDLQLLETLQRNVSASRTSLNTYQSELQGLQQRLTTESAGRTADNLPSSAGRSLSEQKQIVDGLKIKASEIKLELPRLNELSITITQQLAEKHTLLSEADGWLTAHQAEAVLLTDFPDIVKLRNVRTELAEMDAQQKTQGKWSKKTATALSKSKADLTAAEARIKELQNQIESDQKKILEISAGKSFEELKELQADQQTRLNDFQELFSLASVTARLTEKKGLSKWFGNDSKAVEIPDVAQLEAKVAALKLEMSTEENISRALEQAIDNEALLKKLANQRSTLVEGKPCMLCGALHHPYALKPPVATDSKKALADHRGRFQILKTTLNEAQKQLAAAQKADSQLTAKQKFLQEKRSQWFFLANRLNVAREGLEISHVSRQEKLLMAESDELERIKRLVEEHAQLQRNIAKAKSEIEDKQALLSKLRLSTEQLDGTWSDRSPEIEEMDKKFKENQAEEKALLARLEPQLKLLGEKLPGKGKENVLFDRLNTRRQDYQIRELRQQALTVEITDLQEKLLACQKTIERYQQEQSDIQASLYGEEWIALQLTLNAKQSGLAAQQQALADHELALVGFQQTLSTKVAENGFASLDEVVELLRLQPRQAEIAGFIEQQSLQLTAVESELRQLESRLQHETSQFDSTYTEAEIQFVQKQLAEKQDIAGQEIRRLENTLHKQQQYQQKYQLLETELLTAQEMYRETEIIINLIQDEQGGFRRKIQQLLIDKLLSQTNQILEKINGRYYVRSAPSEHGLALEIEDTKQKNARRLPKTLSGGESFIISLALALGLAEIGNNGKTIESLFLDEGFGNLDSEALYLAMGALEGLKIQGKTVGVISHVEGVKKRIKTQIELVKKPNGLSELKLVA